MKDSINNKRQKSIADRRGSRSLFNVCHLAYHFYFSLQTSVLLTKLPYTERSEGKGCDQRGLNTKRATIVFFLDPTKPLPSYDY